MDSAQYSSSVAFQRPAPWTQSVTTLSTESSQCPVIIQLTAVVKMAASRLRRGIQSLCMLDKEPPGVRPAVVFEVLVEVPGREVLSRLQPSTSFIRLSLLAALQIKTPYP
uniref:Uncharacterized protein n=1 Tax=Schistocephalus solidus TaxID=70667 RepID=A0A0X3PP77_SCHSO